ncbi:MAG: hypothetical protein ACLQUT_05305 [Thermoleophilia bacterium]
MTQASKRLEVEQRLERELTLRRRGASYRQIARDVGVVAATVQRDIVRELDRLARANEGKTAEWRELELQRLDALEMVASDVLAARHITVNNGRVIIDPRTGESMIDDDVTLRAIATLLRISERRARLLGLDAPARQEISGSDGGPIDLVVDAQNARERLIAKLEALHRASGDTEP